MTFEASGYYMYHPFAMERLARDLPRVKLVVMLRDPVERAFWPTSMSTREAMSGRASRRRWSWRMTG